MRESGESQSHKPARSQDRFEFGTYILDATVALHVPYSTTMQHIYIFMYTYRYAAQRLCNVQNLQFSEYLLWIMHDRFLSDYYVSVLRFRQNLVTRWLLISSYTCKYPVNVTYAIAPEVSRPIIKLLCRCLRSFLVFLTALNSTWINKAYLALIIQAMEPTMPLKGR